MLFTACSWGLTWPQSKFLLTMLPPFSMRASCGVLGAAFAFLVALARRERIWPPADQWPRLLLFSMLNYGLFIVLTTESLVWLKASEAVVIVYTLPVWAALLAWPMLGERPTVSKVLALVLALGGVALLVGADTAGATWEKLPAAGMGLVAAVLFGLGTVMAKKQPLRLPPATSVAWQAMLGMVLVVALAGFEHPDWTRVTTGGWVSIAYISTIPMTVAVPGVVPSAADGGGVDGGDDGAVVAGRGGDWVGIAVGGDVWAAAGGGVGDDADRGGAGGAGVGFRAKTPERLSVNGGLCEDDLRAWH